jgi:hypothetical protein
MLLIRQEQMEALSAYMRQDFEDRRVRHLLRAFPDKAGPMGEPALRQLIRAGVAKAAGYGIDREGDLGTFIDWMMEYTTDFETSKEMGWTKATLGDQEMSGTAKIKSIQLRLPRMVALGRTY